MTWALSKLENTTTSIGEKINASGRVMRRVPMLPLRIAEVSPLGRIRSMMPSPAMRTKTVVLPTLTTPLLLLEQRALEVVHWSVSISLHFMIYLSSRMMCTYIHYLCHSLSSQRYHQVCQGLQEVFWRFEVWPLGYQSLCRKTPCTLAPVPVALLIFGTRNVRIAPLVNFHI